MRQFSAGMLLLVVVGVWPANCARAQERTVFAYDDDEGRKGCFVHLHGPDWIELTGDGSKFTFKQAARPRGEIELFDKTRGGVGVRLFADSSTWKANEETDGQWEPLWSGSWITAVDLRPEFAKWGLVPTEQGERETCSVFVTKSALEFAFSRYLGREVKLSVEYLNWAANQTTGECSDGQFFHDVLAGFDKFGVCHAESMPYTERFDPDLAPSRKARNEAKRLRAQAGNAIRWNWIRPMMKRQGLTDAQMHEIKGVLARGWPVAAGSDHSRLLIGYQDHAREPGGGHFIVQDSATGSYENVTYHFVKTKVDDVYWIEAFGAAPQAEK